MADVDLAALTDDELHATFDELCGLVRSSEVEDKRKHHADLMAVTQELGRRTDRWIEQQRRRTNA